ncbi:hypothetical protein DM860_007714 [Cuscuta australis]|uniref:Protein TIFY n=1 Tax=Cuscuta australis TaxID=267555 RepID=A0A328E675_9ASTE|nr:hypothetical protein DM860_007714 [Cuscuta australis]
MASQPNSNASLLKVPSNAAAAAGEDSKGNTVFHDFLGKGCAPDSSSPAAAAAVRPPLFEPYPVASSASLGASSCGPVSNTSDMCSGPQTSYPFSGSKRCNSDSNMVSCKDRFPAAQPDSHVMKLLRSGAGGERCRGSPYNEESPLGVHNPMRPLSPSLSMGGATRNYSTTTTSKWVPVNPVPALQYPSHAAQVAPFGYQTPPNRFSRDTNAVAGPSLISQTAADEGSRTGIKGSGVLRMSDRALSGVPLTVPKQNFGIQSSDPAESSNPRHGVGSTGRQMTIFYNGQAHVFDDVHPSKADLIMALAGSNGGSWSTTYSPKSTPPNEGEMGSGSSALLRELQGRSSSLRLNSNRPFGSSDQSFLPPGHHHLHHHYKGGGKSKESRSGYQVGGEGVVLHGEKNVE